MSRYSVTELILMLILHGNNKFFPLTNPDIIIIFVQQMNKVKMKKIYFLFLMTAFLFGFVSNYNVRADCPPGWNESIIIQPYIGDCRIRIVYCYKCGITGADPSNIKITFYVWDNPQSPDCTGEIPFEVVWEAIRQSFYNNCLFNTYLRTKVKNCCGTSNVQKNN
ncbi:MAG: hypothetical protein N2517_08720 [Ignavibacteria bacterium]|nr:hypothetical protein [Ignavibacteria bacterium]